jgi:UDP-N-acetylmuramyl pentapeptide phosphotransferase/UDP-N-acetylglucosamine-1-phosphate transferase
MLSGLLAFAVSALVVRLLLTTAVGNLFLDHPNERSLHDRPVPRTGGLGIVAGICVALGLLVAGAFLVLTVPGLPPMGLVLLTLATGWITNLYNFMDGMDGLAGGMGVIGFAAYGLGAWQGGDTMVAASSLAVAGSVLGFLLFNFPPARVFMGDAGSIPLGFLAAAVGVLGWGRGLWPLWFPLVVFAPFIVDASVTLFRRALRRERLWQAHRSHYYQRLVLMGWSHRRTVLFEYALMLVGAAAALLTLRLSVAGQPAVLGALAVVYAAAMVAIDRRWRARQEA